MLSFLPQRGALMACHTAYPHNLPNLRDVHKWWAEYLESVGDSEGALQYYESAEDYYSMIRVLHYTGHTERAIQLVEETTCKAGAYHLARQLSQESDVRYCTTLSCVCVSVCNQRL